MGIYLGLASRRYGQMAPLWMAEMDGDRFSEWAVVGWLYPRGVVRQEGDALWEREVSSAAPSFHTVRSYAMVGALGFSSPLGILLLGEVDRGPGILVVASLPGLVQGDGGEGMGIGTGNPLLVFVDSDPLVSPTSIQADSGKTRSVVVVGVSEHTGVEDRAGQAS